MKKGKAKQVDFTATFETPVKRKKISRKELVKRINSVCLILRCQPSVDRLYNIECELLNLIVDIESGVECGAKKIFKG